LTVQLLASEQLPLNSTVKNPQPVFGELLSSEFQRDCRTVSGRDGLLLYNALVFEAHA
jgi:hypothetical protein